MVTDDIDDIVRRIVDSANDQSAQADAEQRATGEDVQADIHDAQ